MVVLTVSFKRYIQRLCWHWIRKRLKLSIISNGLSNSNVFNEGEGGTEAALWIFATETTEHLLRAGHFATALPT